MYKLIGDYLKEVKDFGFEEVLHSHYNERPNGQNETYYILAHRDGLLLFVTTYNSHYLNSAKVYFNFQIEDPHDRYTKDEVWHWLGSGHVAAPEDIWVWVGDTSVNAGLDTWLKHLRNHGKFLNPWIERPFLWLITSEDYQVNQKKPITHNWYEKCNEHKINLLPAWVKEMIGPPNKD